MNDYTFLRVDFINNEGYEKWTIIKVPLDWNENEIRNFMMNDFEISEIFDMYETACEDENYSCDFT